MQGDHGFAQRRGAKPLSCWFLGQGQAHEERGTVRRVLSHLLAHLTGSCLRRWGCSPAPAKAREHRGLVVSGRVAVPSVRLASSASVPNLPYLGQRASILIQLVYGEEVNPAPRGSSPVPAKGGTCEFVPLVVFAL